MINTLNKQGELSSSDIERLMPHLIGVVSIEVKLLKRKREDVKQVIIEYKDGSKKIADLNKSILVFKSYNQFNSVNEYISRGYFGQGNYPGNCCGQIIQQFLSYCTKKLGKVRFSDPMCGSGTGIQIAQSMGIPCWGSDLSKGFDVLKNPIPIATNAIWAHVPYFVPQRKDGRLSSMPVYSGVAWGNEKDKSKNDGSHLHNWPEYIKWLNNIQATLFSQLRKGGYLGMLIGASKLENVYYDPIVEMNVYGNLESIVIKKQTNCESDNFEYSNNSFIPIVHEYLLIIKKRDNLLIPVTITKHVEVDIMKSIKITWVALVTNIHESLGGRVSMEQMLKILENHPKAENNNHVREKLRQIYNCFKDIFVKVDEGIYDLAKI